MWTLQNQMKWACRAQWTLVWMIALLIGGFYFVGYRPFSGEVRELRRQITNEERELRAGQSQTSILPTVSSEVERLRARLEKYKAMPRQQELPQFIKDIAQLADQASLKKFDLKPGVPSRDERFNQLPVQLSFEGDFVNVYSFLRHTEELQRLTRVRGMSVKSKDRQGQVRVQLTMNIYFAAE